MSLSDRRPPGRVAASAAPPASRGRRRRQRQPGRRDRTRRRVLTAGPMATGDETVRRMARTVYDFLVTPTDGAVEE
ncbi:hypothetical protein O7634_15055 [Micromonospora sp. WMMD1120]|uniref:hypothetical protein n=1 Tax=Micromonospora sp. WMMD1120 TaxID=3016106 RepID=UPI0024168ECA|nr:hypothetical protein [Micromonospora sp. WMMD1120]MDG4808072.1 hypothetical protein [Micromonospora sp. WMMD1120]